MISSFKRQRYILLLGDVALIGLATQLAPWIRIGRYFNVFDHYTGASLFTLFLYLVMLYIFDMYNMGRGFRSGDTAMRIAVAVGVAGVFFAFLFYSLPNWRYGRGILIIQALLVWGFVTGWRWVYSYIFSITLHKKDVLILGAGRCGAALSSLLEAKFSPYRVVGFLDDDPAKQGKVMGSLRVIGSTDRLEEIASKMGVNTAILAITHDRPSRLVKQMVRARLNGMTILDMPTVYETLTRRVQVEHMYDEWLLFTEGFYLVSKQYVQKVKRLIDIGVSALILLVTLPVTALCALAIRLDSPGPVFFKQKRVGKDGSVFVVWKFRPMRQDAEKNGPMWAEKNDPRVTRVGKWLRCLRVDEIPQLYNVFRGEMSLIGPRPERPEFVQEREKQIPYYGIRHSVRPGITLVKYAALVIL